MATESTQPGNKDREEARGGMAELSPAASDAVKGGHTPSAGAPKLLTRLRSALRVRHYSLRTERAYVEWTRRFIHFQGMRHPADLGAPEVQAFLTHLAVERGVASPTQNQAKAALLFLYREVLGVQLPWLDDIVGAKPARRLPVVLTPAEVRGLLSHLSGTMGLVGALLYGTGLRLLEGLRLRVKDVEFERREILVRDGCRSCWAMPMSRPPWSTPMCSTAAAAACAARSMRCEGERVGRSTGYAAIPTAPPCSASSLRCTMRRYCVRAASIASGSMAACGLVAMLRACAVIRRRSSSNATSSDS
jgi:hypothetical protein